mmetsp:Transcript_14426/g.30336  ORF Transcript_14426/g.30336 Transcript_14426/m.30336 type:complete len:265 (-) Transcript_14426:168-962(-)
MFGCRGDGRVANVVGGRIGRVCDDFIGGGDFVDVFVVDFVVRGRRRRGERRSQRQSGDAQAASQFDDVRGRLKGSYRIPQDSGLSSWSFHFDRFQFQFHFHFLVHFYFQSQEHKPRQRKGGGPNPPPAGIPVRRPLGVGVPFPEGFRIGRFDDQQVGLEEAAAERRMRSVRGGTGGRARGRCGGDGEKVFLQGREGESPRMEGAGIIEVLGRLLPRGGWRHGHRHRHCGCLAGGGGEWENRRWKRRGRKRVRRLGAERGDGDGG